MILVLERNELSMNLRETLDKFQKFMQENFGFSFSKASKLFADNLAII